MSIQRMVEGARNTRSVRGAGPRPKGPARGRVSHPPAGGGGE
jgi:hypothetical protein